MRIMFAATLSNILWDWDCHLLLFLSVNPDQYTLPHGASSGIASKQCAAYQTSEREGSRSATISAHICFTDWKDPITRLNCLRSRE